MSLKGSWGIPLVAFDGTAQGLLPDGRTLLVAQPIYKGQGLRKSTSFAFVDTRKMKVLRKITLKGAFSFDALWTSTIPGVGCCVGSSGWEGSSSIVSTQSA